VAFFTIAHHYHQKQQLAVLVTCQFSVSSGVRD
jgi:hypothetical protein